MIAIGIDIGGTSIKGASINSSGQILDLFSLRVNKADTPEKTIGELSKIILEFLSEHVYEEQISGIGVGVPGIVDFDKGVVLSSPNLPTWNGFNIKEFLQKTTNLPVFLNNDANVAALGECVFGAGKKYQNMILLTLGTGVGGGVIINKNIYDGNEHRGAELGHMVIELNGRECGCGRKGCFEAYASATALIKDTKEAMKNHPESELHKVKEELGEVTARNAFVAARRGDKAANEVVDNYVMYLGEGILNYCNIFRPEAVILSGGVANEGEYLLEKVNAYLKEHEYGMHLSPKVELGFAELGYDSGKIGAACLVLTK